MFRGDLKPQLDILSQDIQRPEQLQDLHFGALSSNRLIMITLQSWRIVSFWHNREIYYRNNNCDDYFAIILWHQR